MRISFRFIVLFHLFLPFLLSSQELPFTHYTPDNEVNPLPSAEVHQVHQDRLGYIWLAIFSSGVIRYDGHAMQLFDTADGLVDVGVRELLEDREGRLWVGSNAGLVVTEKRLSEYAEGERIRFTAKIGSTHLVQTTIRRNRLILDSAGNVWAGTAGDGLIRYHFEDSGQVTTDTIGTDINREGQNLGIRSVVARKDGSVWAGITGGDLLVFAPGSRTYQVISEKEGAPRQNVNILYETPDGVLWGGCRDGLVWRLREKDGEKTIRTINHDLNSNIAAMLATSDTSLYVASYGSGVLKINPADTTGKFIFTRKNGLLSANLYTIIQDREGNLWFGQSAGVSKLKFNYEAFEYYTATSHTGEKPVLPAPAVNAVQPVKHGSETQIWAGTAEGGAVLIEKNAVSQWVQAEQGLKDNWVNGLTLDRQGRVWMGTANGLNCLIFNGADLPPSATEVRSVPLPGRKARLAGYFRSSVYACDNLPLFTDSKKDQAVESVWFPSYNNLYCFVKDKWFVFKERSGLPVSSFQAVTVDDEGRLWVGTRDHGLYRSTRPIVLTELLQMPHETETNPSDAGSRTRGVEIIQPLFEQIWSRANGAPSNQIEILLWWNGALWVGTPEGLVVLQGEPAKMTAYLTQKEGLKANNITSMAFSPVTHSLWVGTNRGLAEIDPQSRRVIRTVTKQDGLVDNEVWYYGSVAIDPDGTVYFGTAKGLSIYRPHLDQKNMVPPILRIEDARFKEDDRGNNLITIEYAALSYANEKLVRYKTRLVGYDRSWSPETAEVKTRYTNLPAIFFPREYRFEVLASNNDGIWTETPLMHSFSVKPAWWLTWWAFVLQGIVLVGLVYGYQRYRTKKLEQQNKQLEDTVVARTEEIRHQTEILQEKNQELEEKNQEIIRTQQQLVVQEKLASLGALTAGIAHEIKNPLNFVNNFAELSSELVQELRDQIKKEQDKITPETTEEIEYILQDLEKNLEKINQHGKRADGIVRGMLQHSRGESAQREEIDINALVDEYVNLSYHGLRAQNSEFNVTIEKEYDPALTTLKVVPQDLSRVFLNIINNACYAAYEKKKTLGDGFSPKLHVSTRDIGKQIEIRIRDNGNGIPRAIRDKIFNPFFTTKPTGQGTGLGLSISYDIVVQEHKGELKVETEEGSFTEFIISLPKN